MLVVVSEGDANAVQDALVGDDFRVTRINTRGGFLRRGNVTLLIGVAESAVAAVIAHIRATVSSEAQGGVGGQGQSAMLVVLPVSIFARL